MRSSLEPNPPKAQFRPNRLGRFFFFFFFFPHRTVVFAQIGGFFTFAVIQAAARIKRRVSGP